MQTPWGRLPIADSHVHFFSRDFFRELARHTPTPVEGEAHEVLPARLGWTPPGEPEDLAADWITEMDKHGVHQASLIASVPGDEASVQQAVAHHPDRFFGYFMLNPAAPGAAARAESALQSGMHGVCLFPAMHRFSVADESVETLLQVVAGHPRAIVFVHCGVLSVGVRKKLGLPSLFDMRYSNPIDLHPVALRHPRIVFVLPHFGAGFFREALMLCDLCPNVYLDTSSSNSWMKYHAPELDLRTVFRRAIDVAGHRRLLFGSDSSFFPRGWHSQILEAQATALYELGLSEHDAALVLGGNLVRLLSRDERHDHEHHSESNFHSGHGVS